MWCTKKTDNDLSPVPGFVFWLLNFKFIFVCSPERNLYFQEVKDWLKYQNTKAINFLVTLLYAQKSFCMVTWSAEVHLFKDCSCWKLSYGTCFHFRYNFESSPRTLRTAEIVWKIITGLRQLYTTVLKLFCKMCLILYLKKLKTIVKNIWFCQSINTGLF